MERGAGSKPTLRDGEEEPADAASSTTPAYHAFSTRDIPAKDRFEIWRDFTLKAGEVEVLSDSPESLEADIEEWPAGLLSILRLNVSKSLYDRTPSFARNGTNDFRFTFCGPGLTIDSKETGTVTLKQGGGFFLARDFSSKVAPPHNSPNVILCIDRAALLELMPRDFELTMQAFAPGDKLLQLLGNMVPLIANRTEPTTRERRETVAQQIIDLVALLLNPSRDGRALIDSRGLKAARLGAVLNAIDRRFADPSLSADSLGAELGISGRQVHRLLLETTKTFYEHLLERRLRHAHEMLLDPRHADLKIVDIAFKTGFTNASFFGQSFRRRFGDTPSGVRTILSAEGSLKVLRDSIEGRFPERPPRKG